MLILDGGVRDRRGPSVAWAVGDALGIPRSAVELVDGRSPVINAHVFNVLVQARQMVR
jgi:hypothetical protein